MMREALSLLRPMIYTVRFSELTANALSVASPIPLVPPANTAVEDGFTDLMLPFASRTCESDTIVWDFSQAPGSA